MMDSDEEENPGPVTAPAEANSGSAVNSLILDYYKKFGRKRDLEQYFSLSTAQSDVKDPSGTFWRKMKSENDSTDSGEKKSDSSQELCRISIRCSIPDPCSSQYHANPTKPILTGSALLESLGINIKHTAEDSNTKSESVSPPIIIEEGAQNVTQHSDEESVKSYDNSHKSFDVLDTSTNKALSPTSSITSQRKLEWDSLADVGYANESDRKTSASSLSTLERLALKQQYSNNDTKLDSIVEPPTAHSTPLDENEAKSKSKKGVGKKSTKIYKKDVDYLEVNMPHTSENNPPQSINVNLTKHIFFNVEKDGKVTVENVHKDVSVSPEKNVETSVPPRDRMDKEMQTSLTKSKDTSAPKPVQIPPQKAPVLISLNTLRRQSRRKKLRMARKKIKSKKVGKENIPVQEKNAEQLSEAESFEYMPGHMYNQNQLTANERSGNTAGNKSSLESSGPLTTDSSNVSKHSFTKDLEKSIDILRAALQRGGDDTNLRKQLIKQVCERLLKSKYRDDESSSAFLSGLSFSSKKLGLGEGNLTTTSTSDNSGEKLKRPKKSILRNDKFNSGALASTSQSAPNLPTATNSEKLVSSNLMKNLTTSNTDSDMSRKDKSSSDNVPKTSSQELYQRYLDALKREEAYKRHLRDKEMFLKQKLVCSDSAIKAPTRPDPKLNNRLKDLIKDLTRNNYDDGSGDASKLEGGPNSSREYDRCVPNMSQRSHSVFTLSSGCNNDQNKKQNLNKRLQSDFKDLPKPGTSKEHYCCSSHHSPKYKTCVVDSSVQVSMMPPCDNSSREHRNLSPRRNEKGESPRSLAKVVPNDATEDIKYVCLCNNKTIPDVPDNFLIFKCSRLSKGNQEETSSNASCFTRNVSPRKNKDSPNLPTSVVQCSNKTSAENVCVMKTTTKSSQTNFLLKMLRRRSSDLSPNSSYFDSNKCSPKNDNCSVGNRKPVDSKVYEATRCLQTEISINPRIPEPSLSDIIIITDCANLVSEHCREISKPEPSLSDINVLTDCANLVNEHFREVSKLSLSDLSSRQTHNVERPYRSGSSKSSGTSKEIGELFEDNYNTYANKGKTFNNKEKVGQGSESDRSEKYTIPIQGTNMTLMVSIGSNERKNKPKDMIGQCVGTERNEVTEQGTSLAEECSKCVQYDVGLSSNQTDHNSNNVGIPKDQIKHPCTVNLATQDPIFNTFPKTSPVNDRKPFRRANTGGDNFEKCAPSVSSDKCAKPPDNKCKTYDKTKRCSCGCFGSKELCNDKCNEKVKSNQIHPIGQTASAEKETQCSEPNSSKCSCGCAGNIENCDKNCDERKKRLPLDSSKCLCGCSGQKDHCNEKCNHRQKSYGTIDKCNKNGEERKESLPSENVKKLEGSICSCGCCGDKEKCNKNCDELKKNVPNQCSCGCLGDKDNCDKHCDEIKKCLDKEKVLTSPRCSCGCGGSIENCKKNCDVRKISLSTQCSCGCSGDKENCVKNCEELKKSYSKEIGIQKDFSSSCPQAPTVSGNGPNKPTKPNMEKQNDCSMPSTSKNLCEGDSDQPSDKCKISESETDPILEMIQNITKKYSKKDFEKNKRKKCFKEIMAVLNYLLETEDNIDPTDDLCITTEKPPKPCEKPDKKSPCLPKKTDKPSCQESKIPSCITESSDCPQSTDIPGTSSDSATCKVLNKIRKECERYHQKRCKIHSGKKCDISSSTSANCDHCRRVHHCSCRTHKCKGHKKCEKIQKKAIAYNLILQTSESISEETVCNDQMRQLQNIVVKVPSQRKQCGNVPFQEMCAKIESRMPPCSPKTNPCRSGSRPNESEISSMEEFLRKSQACCSVREYLEQNRPDFIAKSSQRQNCLRIVSDSRNEDPCCATPQLKMVVVHTPNCTGACNMYQYQTGAPMTCMSTQCYAPCVPQSLNSDVTRIGAFIIRPSIVCGRKTCFHLNLKFKVVELLCENVSPGKYLPPYLFLLQSSGARITVFRFERQNMRTAQRDILSVCLAQLSDVSHLGSGELRQLAKELGRHMRQKPPAPKFISEREMKKHSENIYKSLPEVVQKKEQARKDDIRKTNLLMANIFKKNLQKKTLRGAVDISNYSHIIKI